VVLSAPSRFAAASEHGFPNFEPARGCYIGAFIERDFTVLGDIGAWESLTKKKHASFYTYVGYGRALPERVGREIEARRRGASHRVRAKRWA
jgi:hypothetical protein